MKKNNNNAIADHFALEAERFIALAKDLSLNLLKNPNAPDVEKKKRKAEDHLLRAETYKDAARLASNS